MNKIRYYKDNFHGIHYFFLAIIVITTFIIFLGVYNTYLSKTYLNNETKIVYFFIILFYILIYFILTRGYFKKVAVDEKGNISIHGTLIKKFTPDTYFGTWTGRNFQISKSNINKISLINYKDIKKTNYSERLYLLKTNKVILIEFKKPLKWDNIRSIQSGYIGINMPPLKQIYFSISNPEQFIKDYKAIK